MAYVIFERSLINGHVNVRVDGGINGERLGNQEIFLFLEPNSQ